MPTLQEWENALLMKRSVRIISDDRLVKAVNRRSKTQPYTGVGKRATLAFQVYPNRIETITPFDILGAMGLITTPKIDNLVDLSSTWAKIRYIWAFNPSPAQDYYSEQLRLSEEALNIDFHQKSLLSDEIGMGMASLIMDRFFDAYNPVDVDVVLRHALITGLQRIDNASPDFIFQNKITNSYLVVECKGTRSGYSNAIKQLQRGTEQVRSLRFPKKVVPSFVVSTEISASHTNVYVVDPPGEDDESSGFLIENEVRFRNIIRRLQVANVFRYIGVFGRAYALLPERDDTLARMRNYDTFSPPTEIYDELLDTTIVGVSQSFRFPGEYGLVTVFQGISSQFYDILIRENYDEGETILRRFAQLIPAVLADSFGSREGLYRSRISDESLSATLYQKDGTILKIDVTK
jgi:hypothetical protein